MGYLQPDIAASTEPVSLWHFAKRIASRECAAYLTWYEATATRMREIDHDRVAASVRRRWPALQDPELFLRENEARERRAKRLRGWAGHLLATVIPSKLRRELIKGSYVITGRNSNGERVAITPDDLASLDINLGLGSLVSPTTIFADVSVRLVDGGRALASPEEIEAHASISELAALSSARPSPKPIAKVPVTTQAYDQMKALLSSQENSLPRGRKFPRGVRTQLIRDVAHRLESDESTVRKAVQALFDEWQQENPGK